MQNINISIKNSTRVKNYIMNNSGEDGLTV